jgi:Uma2 family endonuclease
MSALTLPAPPPGQTVRVVPHPHRFTVAEFHRLNSQGMFAGRRPFLLNGVIWEQGPIEAPHGNGVERTDAAVRAVFGTGWRFRVQLPLVLGLDVDPMPDIAVVPGRLTGSPEHPTTAALVIEVSDSTLRVDITEKAEQYATAGIQNYWVLDLNGRQLLVFRNPVPLPAGLGATAYRSQQTLGPNDSVTPLAAPNSSISVGDLLP